MTEVLALIPARSGSKGISHKNIAAFRGKPMMAHSIEVALLSKRISRVVVSTNSETYAEIARQYGAETPFLRPSKIAEDFSTDLQASEHALTWFSENERYRPDICVHLRPTYPNRRSEDVDRAIEILESDQSFDSVRSVVLAPETPYKMWFVTESGELNPVISFSEVPEAYNQPRQLLPPVYLQNANIDVVWSRVILEQRSMTGTKIRAMIQDDFEDIDRPEQLIRSASEVRKIPRGKNLVVDMDGVIATLTPNNDYRLAEPLQDNIDVLNQLYELGNSIVVFTARGTMTGIDWSEATREQLQRWGLKYHELRFGKPAGDYYIDDRSVSIHELKTLLTRSKNLKE